MDEDRTLDECLAYFKERPVYAKLFQKLQEKYASLGYLGGAVVLGGLSQEERSQLGGFFQKDFQEVKRISITVKMLENSLTSSRYSLLSWKEILESYYRKPLVGKQEMKSREEAKRKVFFTEIYRLYSTDNQKETEESMGQRWLKATVEERSEGYQSLMQQYRENPVALRELLSIFNHTLSALPYEESRTELLAVFAAKTTGNPHFYDEGTPGFGLLNGYLKFVLPDMKVKGLSGPEQRNRRLFAAGIIKDELSNYTLAYGIHARIREGGIHPGIEGYCQLKEPVQISLWTIGGLGDICPADGAHIYVLENPAVFALLVKQYPDVTAVCSNGQPRLATLLLLDALAEKGRIYYAGDFDPEGLMIAQRLKERYGERLSFWKYETAYYQRYMSQVVLSDKRIKKLQHVTDPALQEIRASMEKSKRAAYQEAMLEVLLDGK